MTSVLKKTLCCVCARKPSPDQAVLYCYSCNLLVHRQCYGHTVEEPCLDLWKCNRCICQPANSSAAANVTITCQLCPSSAGALKQTDDGAWAHIVCAQYIQGACFGDENNLQPILLKMVPRECFHQHCYICEARGESLKSEIGACVKCRFVDCNTRFHVTCGQVKRLLGVKKCASGALQMCGYCDVHINNAKTKHVISAVGSASACDAGPSPHVSLAEPRNDVTDDKVLSGPEVAANSSPRNIMHDSVVTISVPSPVLLPLNALSVNTAFPVLIWRRPINNPNSVLIAAAQANVPPVSYVLAPSGRSSATDVHNVSTTAPSIALPISGMDRPQTPTVASKSCTIVDIDSDTPGPESDDSIAKKLNSVFRDKKICTATINSLETEKRNIESKYRLLIKDLECQKKELSKKKESFLQQIESTRLEIEVLAKENTVLNIKCNDDEERCLTVRKQRDDLANILREDQNQMIKQTESVTHKIHSITGHSISGRCMSLVKRPRLVTAVEVAVVDSSVANSTEIPSARNADDTNAV